MNRQVKIKEIAQMSGVSAGTVDRIIHNRGNVSEKSRKAVEATLKKVGYKPNLHTSAVSLQKSFNIVITTPNANRGEYWGAILEGIERALEEYSDIKITTKYSFYDQFDSDSCQDAFGAVSGLNPDGVIIGPTFRGETVSLCNSLDERGIPYIFIDSPLEGTSPLASFYIDQNTCGRLMGHILFSCIPEDASIAVFGMERKGNAHSYNSLQREKGLKEFARERGWGDRLVKANIPVILDEKRVKAVVDFFKGDRNIKGAGIMNSRGHIIADILQRNGISGIHIVSFDLTLRNQKCLKEGSISALLCQRPGQQGFSAVQSMISYLLYRKKEENGEHLLPVDIVMKENLPYYSEISDL